MKQVFEYAVIRVMPRVEREEFINVGVILYCKRLKYIGSVVAVDQDRLCCFADRDSMPDILANLAAFENICHGSKSSGPIGALDEASRFRWLTATRSTVVQTSKVHPGMTDDPVATLQRLLEQLVL